MRTFVAVAVLGGSAALYTGAAAQQQEMLARPGPGTGITRVEGTVNIGNSPHIHAAQSGEWRVAQAGEWRVTALPMPFLRPGAAYQVTWPDGLRERIVVASDTGQGWILIEGTPRRWINLGLARSIEEAR